MKPFNATVLLVTALLFAAPALAGAPYHHMHMTATDPAAAAAWYHEHMGGELVRDDQAVLYDDVLVIWFKKDAGFEGSDGSSVDHIGFSFEDLGAKMASYEAAGVKILSEPIDVRGMFKFAFVEDPWGAKIEVMEDHDTLGFHHIHLKGPEPEKIFDWYESSFGGERTPYKGMLPALLYEDVWLLVQGSSEEMAGTRGRVIDHLGWGYTDLEAAAEELKAKGVKFTMEVRPFRNFKIAFVEGPGGVSIELVEFPKD
jgi:lactoylglutathione lyase